MISRTNTLARPSHDKKLLVLLSGIIVTFIAIVSIAVTAGVCYL